MLSFFNILSGGKGAAASIASSIGGAASSAGTLASNTGAAAGAAEKLKRSTQGFDELNKVADNSSAGAGAGGASGGGGGVVASGVDTSALTNTLTDSETKISTFIEKIKSMALGIKDIFQPSIDAWKNAFISIDWASIGEAFYNGLTNIKDSFLTLSEYILLDFIPNIANSFSVNLAPIIGDIFGVLLEQGAKNFETISGIIKSAVNNIIVPALDVVKKIWEDICTTIKDKWDKYGQPIMDNIEEAFDGLRKTIEYLYYEIVEPIAQMVIDAIKEVWEDSLKPLWDKVVDAVLDIYNNLLTLWNKVLKPIIDWLIAYLAPKVKNTIYTIIEIAKGLFKSITDIVGGIITTIKGIVQFVTGVFTGDWRKAWEGVKNIFKGVFESLGGVIKAPLNVIIGAVNGVINSIVSGVNTAIRAINKLSFTVPDWIPNIGGRKFGFNITQLTAPRIPYLAKGGIIDKATLAVIGESGKEAVVPLENNIGWIDTLVDKLAARNQTPTKIILMLDEKELGYASINSINSITKQTGKLQLAFS